jgi:hypothetical protein
MGRAWNISLGSDVGSESPWPFNVYAEIRRDRTNLGIDERPGTYLPMATYYDLVGRHIAYRRAFPDRMIRICRYSDQRIAARA